MDRYREVVNLAPLKDQVADVHHLVLRRDAGQLILESGKLYLLSPVGGRTVAAVFEGSGRFILTPPSPTEQAELKRFAGDTTLDDSLHEAILIFTDSTLDQLHALTFVPGDVPGDVGGHVSGLINSLKGSHDGSFDAGVMRPLLNGETDGFFMARVARNHGQAVLFDLDPSASEAVHLYEPASHGHWALVAQFPAASQPASDAAAWVYRDRLRVPHCKLDLRITENFGGNLDLAGAATLTLAAQEPMGPWLLFDLDPKLGVDSARRGDGAAAPMFKADQGRALWVGVGRRLAAGDSLALTVYYHGEMFDRAVNWFFVQPGAAWYPFNAQGPTLSTFDITYHSPMQYPLVSIGELADSSTEGSRVRVTHWLQRLPSEQATFNLGTFDRHHVQFEGAPPVDVLISEAAHAELRRRMVAAGGVMLEQRNMSQAVAVDVSNSLKLYASLFGPSPYNHFFVTEIPDEEGVSFPGMIDLSMMTFSTTTLDGADEWFRAHETAHQWWGNGVLGSSDRDEWLSEGLASFSALWYLQIERKTSEQYFKFLDHYRTDIEADQTDVRPIWLGHRTGASYDVTIYEKGAWVFNMLRVLMLDLRTMSDDRFKATMQDYYQTYRRPARRRPPTSSAWSSSTWACRWTGSSTSG